ncbi:MAG: fused MFS/spermidine synthase [Variibacter sp.]
MTRHAFDPASSDGRIVKRSFVGLVYVVSFVTGAIVMSFEMLGSRYLNPYFGSGIYTWASLISTVLCALTVGYFIGGWLADRKPSAAVLGLTVVIGAAYLVVLPLFVDAMLEFVSAGIADVRLGSLAASCAVLLFPVTLLGMYSPFAIRLLLQSAKHSGTVSGTVYGVSTAGSIIGTLGTTFFLIPSIGTRAITVSLGVAGVAAGLLMMLAQRRRAGVLAVMIAASLAAAADRALCAEDVVDPNIRATMLAKKDGRLAHIESEYNDIFITKRRAELILTTQVKGERYTESIANLSDPDDLPMKYAQTMTVALLYPPAPKRILMIGLGGGSIPAYLGRFMPDATIDTVEIDPGIIKAAKDYFGILESARLRYVANDGRVFLNRNKDTYDVILVDAFLNGYVPFHLLTKEFFTLIKERLTPGGAAAFNVHDGTRLYDSTLVTLRAVFPTVDLYPSGEYETIMVATDTPALDKGALTTRAEALQARYKFRFAMTALAAKRMEHPPQPTAPVFTDDFAPVNVYDVMPGSKHR